MTHGPCRAGLEKTLKATSKGRKAERDAWVAAARQQADALDADPSNAALWREYRGILAELLRSDDGDSDSTQAFLLKVTTPGVRS